MHNILGVGLEMLVGRSGIIVGVNTVEDGLITGKRVKESIG